MVESTLSVVEGINIQQRQIEQWALVLKPEILKELREEAAYRNKLLFRSNDRNSKLKHPNPPWTGFHVWRGTMIDSWIANRAVGHSAKQLREMV